MVSSIVMLVFVMLIRQSLVVYNLIQLQTFFGVFLQLVVSGVVGVFFYVITAYLLKSEELKLIKESFFVWQHNKSNKNKSQTTPH